MGLPKDGEQGCLFVQKTEFSVFGLILSCHPILQEFSVVRIDINPPFPFGRQSLLVLGEKRDSVEKGILKTVSLGGGRQGMREVRIALLTNLKSRQKQQKTS